MKVFLSHIHEEAKLALILKEWIESTFAGQLQVFVSSDIKDIPIGSRWFSDIDSALSSSSLFVMLCSRASVSRSWINFEAGCAWIKQVPLMPLCHSGLRKSELPSPLSALQAIELDSEQFIDDLFESIKIHSKISKLPRIDKKLMRQELDQAFRSIEESVAVIQAKEIKANEPISDNDALNLIESWMGHRSITQNTKVIKYSGVDSELILPEGTAKRLIEAAASRCGYAVSRKGDDTILFERIPLRPRRLFH
jgi:hypothetical protein